MKTLLITGCSSGFGLETAQYFLARDWNVLATLRTPRAGVLPACENLRVLPLDVTRPESIRTAIEAAGPIEVLVNHAGIGMAAPLEVASMTTVHAVSATNRFGTMTLTQAVLPQFRQRRAGGIVNISSSLTLKSMPLVAACAASKAAVDAFTESLAEELEAFGVRVHLVLPGHAPETPFAENGRQSRMQGLDHEAYAEVLKSLLATLGAPRGAKTRPLDVAEAAWRAANDPSCPLRLPAGADAIEWANAAHNC